MLLKSSSSPVTGTPFQPFSGSPNRDSDTIHGTHTTHHTPFRDKKLSFSHGLHHLNLASFSCCSSSPVSDFNHEIGRFRLQGFRRAWSDGCLERLNHTSCDKEQLHSTTLKKLPHMHQGIMLHTAPSFSILNTINGFEDEENAGEVVGRQENENEEELDRSATIGEGIEAMGSGEFSFGKKIMLHTAPSFSIFNTINGFEDEENAGEVVGRQENEREEELDRSVTIGEGIEAMGSGEFSFGKKSMGLIEEEGEEAQEEGLNGIEGLSIEGTEPASTLLYLAAGIGNCSNVFCGHGGGGGSHVGSNLSNFDDGGDIEEYYKRMVDEYPCHPLFLSNYAQLLQSKGDLHGAEEYYRRATLADPEDGQISLQYAKLEWELHHNQDRAMSNFERAVQAAPQDSYVLAAYASFLWEMDDDGENDVSRQEYQQQPGSRIDVGDPAASAKTAGNLEEYYGRMSKGDLQGAEACYSGAMLGDPEDGEIMAEYAKFLWEIHHDHNNASHYFERAVQATSGDSYVLAAYASFLWETPENEEDSA